MIGWIIGTYRKVGGGIEGHLPKVRHVTPFVHNYCELALGLGAKCYYINCEDRNCM